MSQTKLECWAWSNQLPRVVDLSFLLNTTFALRDGEFICYSISQNIYLLVQEKGGSVKPDKHELSSASLGTYQCALAGMLFHDIFSYTEVIESQIEAFCYDAKTINWHTWGSYIARPEGCAYDARDPSPKRMLSVIILAFCAPIAQLWFPLVV